MNQFVRKITKIRKTKKMKYFGAGVVTLCIALNLSGCASSHPPQNNISEAHIYHMAMEQSNSESLKSVRKKITPLSQTIHDANLDKANVLNNLNQQFPLLPNPQTIVYVYPHLSVDGVPIPGYYTAFRLSDKNHYALPGEVNMTR